ncbi:MAG: ATP-binding protein [Clostridia bacterium]|nr:ATP-binding protein [Clostridia bacterium]
MHIYPDGICHVQGKQYNKTLRFGDINYQLATNEDKTAVFENWCDFYNYFDSGISVQVTCLNQYSDAEEMGKLIEIPDKDDEFNDIRHEYSEMLTNQLTKGNNGITRKKYITFGIDAENHKEAKLKLERIETDILNSLHSMGVKADSLTGFERLKLLHSILNQNSADKFLFSYDLIKDTGLSTKDFISPTFYDFRNHERFKMGRTYGASSYLMITSPELSDRMLSDFLDIDNSMLINMHIRSIDQTKAIKNVKAKISDLDKMKAEEQKKAVRAGYDMEILPPDLVTYTNEAKKLLEDLQTRNERMFLVTFIITNFAKSAKELENNVAQISSLAQKYNCNIRRLDYRQEQGLISSIPIGNNLIDIERGLTTSGTAVFVPFTTEELFQTGKALYCGINALSNNLIMADRLKLKNPNGLILGTPGSGKSFAAKREITNVFLVTDDDIIISDPESEYGELTEALHGQVIKISPISDQYINPMDINLNYSEDESPVSLKSDFVISLCELILSGREGLAPTEKTIIDRCVKRVYEKYMQNPIPENMPILEDLYISLREQREEEAQRIATALEMYVKGSLNVFNHRTNVDTNNRIICFDTKELGKNLKKIGMLIVEDQVWNRVTGNREKNKITRYFADEFHLLLKDEQTAQYSVEIWKRFRKWGGVPTALTQNIKDFLNKSDVENIVENSDYILMLNQGPDDRKILADKLNISPHQLSFVTNAEEGAGLLFYGNTIIPFRDRFPKDTKLYRLMTTKVSDKEEQI